MKIMAVSDLHGVPSLYRAAVAKANAAQVDVILLAGDVLPTDVRTRNAVGFAAEQEAAAPKLDQILAEAKAPVLYIHGNDDWGEARFQHATNIEMKLVEIGGAGFWGFPYVPLTPFNTNRERKSAEMMFTLHRAAEEMRLHERLLAGLPTLMVGHSPPRNHRDHVLRGERVGSEAILEFLKEMPHTAYLCGHIHEDGGISVLRAMNHYPHREVPIFNAASQYERHEMKGFILTLDLASGQVEDWEAIREVCA